MHIIDQKLKERAANQNPIRLAVIGAGEMAKGLINQIHRYTPGMEVTGIYSRTREKAEKALEVADIKNYLFTNNLKDANDAIAARKTIITNELDLLLQSGEIDAVLDMTGHIEFGLDATLRSFEAGKHVVSFNAELESTFGPLLKHKAQQNNVRYTLGDGDQPGVTLNLYRYVKSMGFTPLLCGNIKGMLDKYRTPATQAGFAEKWGMNPVMATNFVDGTKVSFEQSCIANATDMSVAQRGMIGFEYDGHIDDLTQNIDIHMLEENGGIVDYVLGAKPGPGVFVFASANDAFSKHYMDYSKMGKGPLYSFYVPYHLLFFEIPFSVARLVDYNDITLDAAYGLKVEVCAFAKKDLDAGTQLDGIGGFYSYGLCENYGQARADNLLPMGLCQNAVLQKNIPKDTPVTFDDVEFPQNASLPEFYKQQKKLLL